MPDLPVSAHAALASELKDWLSCFAIIVGGAWAGWRFSHSEWLRRRSEIPSLEGVSSSPECTSLADDLVAVSLRWTWRNAGSRPVFVNPDDTCVEIFQILGIAGTFIDPRQGHDVLVKEHLIASHRPLVGFGIYQLEPGTTSTILTVPVLPRGQVYVARHNLAADDKAHPSGHDWSYSWERWQIFTTDPPT